MTTELCCCWEPAQTLPGTVPGSPQPPSRPGLPCGGATASATLSSYTDHSFSDAGSTQRGEDMGAPAKNDLLLQQDTFLGAGQYLMLTQRDRVGAISMRTNPRSFLPLGPQDDSSPGDTPAHMVAVWCSRRAPAPALPALADAHCGTDACGVLVRHAARALHALR